MLSVRISLTASRGLSRVWVYPMFQTYFTRLLFHVKKRIWETCRTSFSSNINTCHSPFLIHWTYGEKCPTHNQCDDIFSATQSTLHHQIHEGQLYQSILPHHPSCPQLLLPHNGYRLPQLSERSFPVNRHPPPNLTAPKIFSGLEKIWDFYSNIRGEPWKMYHLLICFISWDESVLHLKNSSLIQATRQGFLQVEFTQRWCTPFLRYKGICLGVQTFDWDIGKLHKKKSSPWQNSEHVSGRFLSKNLIESAILSDSYVAKPVDRGM